MQIKVKNRETLLSHGDAEGRKIVLDITEKTLQQLDAYERIKRITHMEGDVLCIGSRRWDLSKKRNVYLLGAGNRRDPRRPSHARHCDRQDQRADGRVS